MKFNGSDLDYLIMTEGETDKEFKLSDLFLETSVNFDPYAFEELCMQSVWSMEISSDF